VTDLSQLPSAQAAAKLRLLLDARSKVAASGSETMVARLTHARLFGSDSPYEDRSPEQLMQQIRQIRHMHRYEDEHFLYEQHGQEFQLMALNQGEQVMPNHNALYVATRLPGIYRDKRWLPRPAGEHDTYPAVTLKDDSIHVSSSLGDISTDAIARVFETPLKVCIGHELKGRKIEIRYALHGSNLRKPAKGRLRLQF